VLFAEPSSQNSRATANMCRRSRPNSDGSQTALAILFDDVDATNGDVIAAAITREAEVRADDLTFDASINTPTLKVIAYTQLAVNDSSSAEFDREKQSHAK